MGFYGVEVSYYFILRWLVTIPFMGFYGVELSLQCLLPTCGVIIPFMGFYGVELRGVEGPLKIPRHNPIHGILRC